MPKCGDEMSVYINLRNIAVLTRGNRIVCFHWVQHSVCDDSDM